jgi:hypothetical protein
VLSIGSLFSGGWSLALDGFAPIVRGKELKRLLILFDDARDSGLDLFAAPWLRLLGHYGTPLVETAYQSAHKTVGVAHKTVGV